MRSEAFETLFGGAAGGGKSHGQLLDALRFAVVYPGSRQLMLRRTMPELERSLVPAALRLYPQSVASYKVSEHRWNFINGSTLEFGYCDAESDVTKYQSAEYDVIRFDELTHFTESQFTYLISRIRGANPYPKQVKSTTNPGGIGHQWVKSRYIDPMPPNEVHAFDGETRLFLPARLKDNPFLRRADAGYEKRLRLLSVHDRRALLDGVWELDEGRYFSEFSPALHIVPPHEIPREWQRFLTIDYGLDMLAALWIAQSPDGRSVVYRELYEPGLIISEAARAHSLLRGVRRTDRCSARAARPVEPAAGNRQERGRAVRRLRPQLREVEQRARSRLACATRAARAAARHGRRNPAPAHDLQHLPQSHPHTAGFAARQAQSVRHGEHAARADARTRCTAWLRGDRFRTVCPERPDSV